MASCIFSFEGFRVYNILFLKPRTHSWQLLFIAACFCGCCYVVRWRPRVYQSLFGSLFFFFFSFLSFSQGMKGLAFSQDTVLMTLQILMGTPRPSNISGLQCSTRLAAGCRSSGCASGCSWEQVLAPARITTSFPPYNGGFFFFIIWRWRVKILLLSQLPSKFLSRSWDYDIIVLHVDTTFYHNCFALFLIKG